MHCACLHLYCITRKLWIFNTLQSSASWIPNRCDFSWIWNVEDATPPPINHQQLESWSDMCDAEEYPPSSLAIGSWELMWHVQCGGGPIHPLLAIGSWGLKWHVACKRLLTHPLLTIGSWGLKWHVGSRRLLTHPLLAIGKLRVEVTCAMWRRTPISHWLLRVEVTCAIWRRTHPPPLAIES